MILKKLIKSEEFSLKNVILFAVLCGVVTGAVLDVELMRIPVLKDSSLFNIGICFEFWVLATMLIVSRTKKPIEAALKVFLFFLISQPLVYLIKVPVDERGWSVFADYTGWFIWTLLTFPGAFIAWYTNRKDNLAIAIFMVAVLFLSYEFAQHFRTLVTSFPYQLVACSFILFEITAFVVSFEGKRKTVFAALSALSIVTVTVLFLV